MYHDVLIPTDGSEAADAAVAHAIDHAVRYGATLHVVHVVDALAVPSTPDGGRILDALEQQGRAAIEEIAERATDADVSTVQSAVLSGPPHRAILDYVDEPPRGDGHARAARARPDAPRERRRTGRPAGRRARTHRASQDHGRRRPEGAPDTEVTGLPL